jgi:hypothetical protein
VRFDCWDEFIIEETRELRLGDLRAVDVEGAFVSIEARDDHREISEGVVKSGHF